MAAKPKTRAWQRMLSGRRLDLLDPSPFDVEIEDIAHGLARVARWNGQTHGEHIFSVAQHSLLVEQIALVIKPGLSHRERLTVLLHDAPEYVVGDMISPFKAAVGGDYKAVEHRLQAAIHLRFGLAPEPDKTLHALTKRADKTAAFLEAVALAGFARDEALAIFGAPDEALLDSDLALPLEPLPVGEAKQAFLTRFSALMT